MIIIGITGTIGAGKGSLVDYLVKKYNFSHYSVRTFLEEEIQRRGLPNNRDSMVLVSNDLRATHHPGYIIEELYKKALILGKNSVIESIRTVGEIDVLRAIGKPFFLVAVSAELKTRYERIVKRNQSTDHVSFEKFKEDEAREMESSDPTKQNLSACIKRADFLISNNGTREELWHTVDEIITSFFKKDPIDA